MDSSPPDRILLADPDADERQRLAEVIRTAAAQTGHTIEIDEAPDGTTAMTMWTKAPPVLVICEILLDGLSGLSLLRRMKTEPGPAVPVIFVTRLSRESDRYWGLRNGAHAYLPKPYDDEQLARRVEDVLVNGAEASRQRPLE